MPGNKDPSKLTIPLTDHEQILLQRYIDAEREEPDFIQKGLSKNFVNEIFLFVYYAGHGCSDNKQYFVLNERTVDEIFWPAESKIKLILKRAGSNCKALVIYDCCREDYPKARERVIKAHQKI